MAVRPVEKLRGTANLLTRPPAPGAATFTHKRADSWHTLACGVRINSAAPAQKKPGAYRVGPLSLPFQSHFGPHPPIRRRRAGNVQGLEEMFSFFSIPSTFSSS